MTLRWKMTLRWVMLLRWMVMFCWMTMLCWMAMLCCKMTIYWLMMLFREMMLHCVAMFYWLEMCWLDIFCGLYIGQLLLIFQATRQFMKYWQRMEAYKQFNFNHWWGTIVVKRPNSTGLLLHTGMKTAGGPPLSIHQSNRFTNSIMYSE